LRQVRSHPRTDAARVEAELLQLLQLRQGAHIRVSGARVGEVEGTQRREGLHRYAPDPWVGGNMK
jgi:hypothetical protein